MLCDKYPLSSNNGIGSSSKEVLAALTWDKRAGGTIHDPLLLLVTNTYFLPMLGRDLRLRTHFVRFLAPRGWGCVVTHCLDTLKRRRALIVYKRRSCIMIWLHNFSGYSCIGITLCKRISRLIIGNLFPSQGINSWLSKSIAQDRWTHYILPRGLKYRTKVVLGDVGIKVLLSKSPHSLIPSLL